ncbi:hypothetical protein EJB05_00922 [Eragrostis curvula]|uniref:Uncharacterized protein n=1 Tax=Eragrostis curvula TaxID=38414 RepID=A0A5J9WNZ3_9POAL|nr:hypothetical protein EJB05_00922 [Eragrostis curvula]
MFAWASSTYGNVNWRVRTAPTFLDIPILSAWRSRNNKTGQEQQEAFSASITDPDTQAHKMV